MTNIVGILGDTHGQQRWTGFCLWAYRELGITTVYQVGDFGFSKSNSDKSDPFSVFVNETATRLGIHVVVVPGNHEDYDLLGSIPISADGWQHYMDSIDVAPRGHRWTDRGVSFVALGGAPSVDRQWRLANQRPKRKLWWAQEAITREDVDKTVAGGYADVMLAHDAPFVNQIQERIAKNPFGFAKQDLDYAYEGRKLIDEAFVGVKPILFFHGHYHFPVDETVQWHTIPGQSRVFGLDCDGSRHAIGFLNLDTLEPSVLKSSDYERLLTEYQKARF